MNISFQKVEILPKISWCEAAGAVARSAVAQLDLPPTYELVELSPSPVLGQGLAYI